MVDMTEHPASPEESASERVVEIRTAPSFPAFITLGVLVGFVVAALVTFLGPENESYHSGAVLGVMLVIFGTLGAAGGIVLALVLERIGKKRAVTARAIPTE